MNIDYNDIFVKKMHNKMSKSGEKLVNYVNISVKVRLKSLSHIKLFATPWTAASQASPFMGFSRQEYWRGVPLPSPSHELIRINPGIFVGSLPFSVSVVELKELSLGPLGAPVWRNVCETGAQRSAGRLMNLSGPWSCCSGSHLSLGGPIN